MRRLLLVIVLALAAAACTPANDGETIVVDTDDRATFDAVDPVESDESPGLEPAAALSAAGAAAADDRTFSFEATTTDGFRFPGIYSVSAGMTYFFDAGDMGFESDEPKGQVVVNGDGVFVSTNFFVGAAVELAEDSWVEVDEADEGAQFLTLFDFLAGDLAMISQSPSVQITELAREGPGRRFAVSWPTTDDPLPSVDVLELVIGSEGRIVATSFEIGGDRSEMVIFDHGAPVDIPVPTNLVTEEEVFGQTVIDDDLPTEPDLSGVSQELDQLLNLSYAQGESVVLVVVTDWCSNVCDEQVERVAEALELVEDPPIVGLIVSGDGGNDAAERYGAVLPRKVLITDPDGAILERMGALAVPALVVVRNDRVVDIVVGAVDVADTQFLLEEAGR